MIMTPAQILQDAGWQPASLNKGWGYSPHAGCKSPNFLARFIVRRVIAMAKFERGAHFYAR